MKIYTCPKCGNVITNGESLYACPKCGCSADSFIVTDREETTSNNYNVSDSEQYKKESGIDQPVLSAKDYDVICPDCNSVIANENSDCSICGCPSNLFIKRAKTKFVYGEKLECPDCGKIFDEEPIPSSCPNCGCPSDKFKQHIEENTHQNSSTQNKNAFSAIFITLFIVGILGGFGYMAYSKVQEAAEQTRQEQHAQERAAQAEKERQEEERVKDQQIRELRQAKEKFLGTYSSTSVSGGYQSGYGRFYITFYSDNTFDLRFVDSYTRNVLDRQTGTYTFVYQKTPREDGGGRLIDSSGRLINEYYIATLGFSINIGDYYLTK